MIYFYLQELERFKTAGLVKHLGVSNFNKIQVQRLLDNSAFKPEVLQVNIQKVLQNRLLGIRKQ